MSTISGDNITYTTNDITSSYGTIIRRIGLTAASTDNFPDATSFIFAILGANDDSYNGYAYPVSIFNNSSFTITQIFGTGMTLYPDSTDTILPGVTRSYAFVQSSSTTLNVYITAGAAGSSYTGIILPVNQILVGDASNQAVAVTMSGDTTIVASGAVTISNGVVTNAKLQNSSLTVTAGDGLQNGGLVSLGGSTTINVNTTVIRTTGAQFISGPKTFTDSIKLEDPGASDFTWTLLSPTLTTNYTWTFPVNDGLSGEVLVTDGNGILSWVTNSGGGDVSGPASSTDNALARFDGTTGKIIQNSVGILDDLGNLSGLLSVSATTVVASSSTITNMFGSAITVTSGTFSNLTATSATIPNLSATSVTAASSTITNMFGTTLSVTSATIPNISATSVTAESSTITNMFGSAITVTTLTSTVGTIANLSATTINTSNITATSIAGSSSTITNMFGTTLSVTSATIPNLSATSVTAASSTITNMFGTTLSVTSATIPNITATSVTASSSTITNMFGSAITVTSATITAATISSLSTTSINTANITATSITGGSSTITNMFGSAITVTSVTATAGNITTLIATSINSSNITVTSAAITSASITRLFIDGESIAGQKLFYGIGPSTTLSISATTQTINFTTSVIIDTGYINTSGQLTLLSAGTYQLAYWAQFFNTAAGVLQGSYAAHIQVSTGGVFRTLAGTTSECFIASGASGVYRPGCGKTVYYSSAAGNVIRVVVQFAAGTVPGILSSGKSTLTIARLRP